jgi:hypothetical protein
MFGNKLFQPIGAKAYFFTLIGDFIILVHIDTGAMFRPTIRLVIRHVEISLLSYQSVKG